MTDLPMVSVILLSWNRREDTLACLESLQKVDYPCMEIILVDQASLDGTVEAVTRQFPGVRQTQTGGNLGFTGGNNLGLQAARRSHADYALLLNNDTEVAPDFLTRLVGVAEAHPQVAALSPNIYYYSQPDVFWTAGGHLNRKIGRAEMVGIGETDRGQYGRGPHSVDFVTGCAMLVRMPVVEQLGGLDERFFAYYEDVEWCARMRQAGYEVWQVPEAVVWHKISPEAREASPQVHYYMTRNRLLLLQLSHANPLTWGHILIGEYLRTLVSWTVRPSWRHKKEQRKTMLRAIRDYFRGYFGPMES